MAVISLFAIIYHYYQSVRRTHPTFDWCEQESVMLYDDAFLIIAIQLLQVAGRGMGSSTEAVFERWHD